MNKTLALLPLLLGFAGQSPRAESEKVPELIQGQWLNTGGLPLTLESRRGKPTLVAFWTFACSNCQANFPAYARLYRRYHSKGVELIAIHTPELEIERQPDQVAAHVRRAHIDYPVLIDGEGKNWTAWKQEYWPTLYVLDEKGCIRLKWEGELNYQGAAGERQVSALLDQLLAQK